MSSFGSIQDPNEPPVQGDAAAIAPGEEKNLSTAMKCVLSLTILYYTVLILARVITIKVSIAKLAAATMGAPMTDTPEQKRQKAASAKARERAIAKQKQKLGLKPDAELPEPGGFSGFVKSLFSKKKLDLVMVQMAMVPMFAIFCVFMRLRAKVDMNSEPQRYAKDSMIVATAALFVQVLGILLPHWPERANVPPGTVTGPWLYKWFKIILEYGMVLALGVCIGIMAYSIFTIRFESTREEMIQKTLSKPPRNPNPAGEEG